MNLDYSVIFEIAPKYCISDSFVDYKGATPFLLRDSSRYNDHLNYMHPFPSIFIHWFLRHRCSIFLSPACMCTQLCLTLFDPVNCYPAISCPWEFPGKNTMWVAISFSMGVFPTQGLNLWVSSVPCITGECFTTEPLRKPTRDLLLDHFTLIHGPNIPHSYTMLIFTA